MKLVEDYRAAGFCSDLVAVVDAKDAEIERLRAALKDIGAAQWGMDVATLRRIAREALAVNEQETRLVPKRAWEIIIEARRDGWYEDHSGWLELDEIIRTVEQSTRAPVSELCTKCGKPMIYGCDC